MDVSYPPPVGQLLALGRPDSVDWLDYRSLGISDEHVPVLAELLRDDRLSWDARQKDEDETPFWADTHAIRALGQLGGAPAVDALLRRLAADPDDEWASEDIPVALGMIGPAALDAVRQALPAAARSRSWSTAALGNALQEIAERHPESRDAVVAALTERLTVWREQDEELNAFLVSNLLHLRAAEAAPAIQAAYEGGGVDENVNGDWEDVQVELGLLPERLTPRPRPVPFFSMRPFSGSAAPERGERVRRTSAPPAHPVAKVRSLRKAQKKKANKRRGK